MIASAKLSLLAAAGFCAVASGAAAQTQTGAAAFGDWSADRPGLLRHIQVADLPAPAPVAAPSAPGGAPGAGRGPAPAVRGPGAPPAPGGFPQMIPRPEGAQLQTLPGFTATEYGSGFTMPRYLTVAPNGDVFVAEQTSNRVKVLRPGANGAAPTVETFAENLRGVFGIALYPANNPQWIYVAENNSIKRFVYRAGDMRARGAPETVVETLSANAGGHVTRDIAFTQNGSRMLVSIGSQGNFPQGAEPARTAEELAAHERANGIGAAWGNDTGRATVISFTPTGQDRRPFANGLRNCVALERNPINNDVYCAVNERDGGGDNLVPDYLTRVREGGFYGWPWFALSGSLPEARVPGQRPDLASRVTTPDVLFQAHSAAVGIAFYPTNVAAGGRAYPAAYRGSAFVTLHGSWNRSSRTGYKVVRVPMNNGVPTGQYEDFVTGFVAPGGGVWGRPSGIAVMRDGSLLFTDPEGNKLWRVAYTGQ